jgi:uncharacterized Zn-finger protein
MAFQFQCPQGHVLETEESFAGQPCQCPYCGTTFPIPAPPRSAHSPPHASPPQPAAPPPPSFSPPGAAPAPFGAPQVGPGSQPGPTPAPFKPDTDKPDLLHIACPNGHELETPRDMLGQDVLCPHCNVQFRLREKDSVEYKRRRALELERKERKAGKMWLNYAIVAAVLVVIGIIGLIVASASN